MTPFFRIAAMLVCVAGVVALWVHQTRRDLPAVATGHFAAALEVTRPAAEHPRSPWDEAAEAQARWAEEVKRHKPACDALGEFLAACEPLVRRIEARADATPVEVRSLEQFAPDPAVRAFLRRGPVLLAKHAGGRLRPCCSVCDPLCTAGGFAKLMQGGAVAGTPDAAAEAALLLIVRRAARESCSHDVILVDVAGEREVTRYRVFRGAAEWRRRRAHGSAPAEEADPVARLRVNDDLTPFLGRLLFECTGPRLRPPTGSSGVHSIGL